MEVNKILETIIRTLDEKKAMDLAAINVTDLTVIADYFILATATSATHVRALAEEVEDKLLKNGISVGHIEGRATDWILLDYGDIVIHIFGKQSREFYSLDHMWDDGKRLDISGYLLEEEK
ncbi:MAG: ribosome silencing factor [Oscillospiraceae bacterium]